MKTFKPFQRPGTTSAVFLASCLGLAGCASSPTCKPDANAADGGFRSQMMDAINKEKRYPKEAVITHTEGVVTASFDYMMGGKAVNIRVDKSSGNYYLDHMTLLMIERATLPVKTCEFESISHFVIAEKYELGR